VPPFAQSLATFQQLASAATDQLQTETNAAVQATSESIVCLVGDCGEIAPFGEEGLALTIIP
jgi:hypothetical protein